MPRRGLDDDKITPKVGVLPTTQSHSLGDRVRARQQQTALEAQAALAEKQQQRLNERLQERADIIRHYENYGGNLRSQDDLEAVGRDDLSALINRNQQILQNNVSMGIGMGGLDGNIPLSDPVFASNPSVYSAPEPSPPRVFFGDRFNVASPSPLHNNSNIIDHVQMGRNPGVFSVQRDSMGTPISQSSERNPQLRARKDRLEQRRQEFLRRMGQPQAPTLPQSLSADSVIYPPPTADDALSFASGPSEFQPANKRDRDSVWEAKKRQFYARAAAGPVAAAGPSFDSASFAGSPVAPHVAQLGPRRFSASPRVLSRAGAAITQNRVQQQFQPDMPLDDEDQPGSIGLNFGPRGVGAPASFSPGSAIHHSQPGDPVRGGLSPVPVAASDNPAYFPFGKDSEAQRREALRQQRRLEYAEHMQQQKDRQSQHQQQQLRVPDSYSSNNLDSFLGSQAASNRSDSRYRRRSADPSPANSVRPQFQPELLDNIPPSFSAYPPASNRSPQYAPSDGFGVAPNHPTGLSAASEADRFAKLSKQEQYQRELAEQVRMKKEKAEREKQAQRVSEQRMAAQTSILDNFGKGGGGAPIRDSDGRVVAGFANMRSQPHDIPAPSTNIQLNNMPISDQNFAHPSQPFSQPPPNPGNGDWYSPPRSLANGAVYPPAPYNGSPNNQSNDSNFLLDQPRSLPRSDAFDDAPRVGMPIPPGGFEDNRQLYGSPQRSTRSQGRSNNASPLVQFEDPFNAGGFPGANLNLNSVPVNGFATASLEQNAPGNRGGFMSGISSLKGGPSAEEKAAKDARKSQYQRELLEQMKEKAERKKKEDEEKRQRELKEEREMANYNPFGRAGAGAPVRDADGHIVASRGPGARVAADQPPGVSAPPPHSNGTDRSDAGSSSNAYGGAGGRGVFDDVGSPFGNGNSINSNALDPLSLANFRAASDVGSDRGPGYDNNNNGQANSNNSGDNRQPTPSGGRFTRFKVEDMPPDARADLMRKQKAKEEIQNALDQQIAEKKRAKEEAKRKEEEEERRMEEKARREAEQLSHKFEKEKASEKGGSGSKQSASDSAAKSAEPKREDAGSDGITVMVPKRRNLRSPDSNSGDSGPSAESTQAIKRVEPILQDFVNSEAGPSPSQEPRSRRRGNDFDRAEVVDMLEHERHRLNLPGSPQAAYSQHSPNATQESVYDPRTDGHYTDSSQISLPQHHHQTRAQPQGRRSPRQGVSMRRVRERPRSYESLDGEPSGRGHSPHRRGGPRPPHQRPPPTAGSEYSDAEAYHHQREHHHRARSRDRDYGERDDPYYDGQGYGYHGHRGPRRPDSRDRDSESADYHRRQRRPMEGAPPPYPDPYSNSEWDQSLPNSNATPRVERGSLLRPRSRSRSPSDQPQFSGYAPGPRSGSDLLTEFLNGPKRTYSAAGSPPMHPLSSQGVGSPQTPVFGARPTTHSRAANILPDSEFPVLESAPVHLNSTGPVPSTAGSMAPTAQPLSNLSGGIQFVNLSNGVQLLHQQQQALGAGPIQPIVQPRMQQPIKPNELPTTAGMRQPTAGPRASVDPFEASLASESRWVEAPPPTRMGPADSGRLGPLAGPAPGSASPPQLPAPASIPVFAPRSLADVLPPPRAPSSFERIPPAGVSASISEENLSTNSGANDPSHGAIVPALAPITSNIPPRAPSGGPNRLVIKRNMLDGTVDSQAETLSSTMADALSFATTQASIGGTLGAAGLLAFQPQTQQNAPNSTSKPLKEEPMSPLSLALHQARLENSKYNNMDGFSMQLVGDDGYQVTRGLPADLNIQPSQPALPPTKPKSRPPSGRPNPLSQTQQTSAESKYEDDFETDSVEGKEVDLTQPSAPSASSSSLLPLQPIVSASLGPVQPHATQQVPFAAAPAISGLRPITGVRVPTAGSKPSTPTPEPNMAALFPSLQPITAVRAPSASSGSSLLRGPSEPLNSFSRQDSLNSELGPEPSVSALSSFSEAFNIDAVMAANKAKLQMLDRMSVQQRL